MALPDPLPDDPKKWDGWRNYDSDNYYERLCLSYDDKPDAELIEENCRQLLVWWQKKLPLKNQLSNPVAAMLRSGLDNAPRLITHARSELLNPEARARFDDVLRSRVKERAHEEFHKYLSFSIADGVLTQGAESRLIKLGSEHDLTEEEVTVLIDHELETADARRQTAEEIANRSGMSQGPTDPKKEFIRLLDLSGLEGDEMTDDQRDALINMAENLGLDPGDAEDMVDDWIEEQTMAMVKAMAPANKPKLQTVKIAPPPATKSGTSFVNQAAGGVPHKTAKVEAVPEAPRMSPAEEAAQFSTFTNTLGQELIFIPSQSFEMGSTAMGAAPNERPVRKVSVSRFHISRLPVTNALYEQFDPTHRSKRPPWSKDDHPVVHVANIDAAKFCEWLGAREIHRYRLPTEAEWELAARGTDARKFPWGNQGKDGVFGNFADCSSRFGWRDPNVDDGFAETSPVGHYPSGASPFGLLDAAGNVWEWCSDYYDNYELEKLNNPIGPPNGSRKVLRGGSWRSRMASLRATARSFNVPGHYSDDVGFRIVAECSE